MFKIIIPLSFGSMTKVGPGTSPLASAQVSAQVGKSSGQVDDAVISVKLEITKLNALLEYCAEARTRAEMQTFCEISSRDYFRNKILLPLLESGRLKRTIPDKPNSSKQRYISDCGIQAGGEGNDGQRDHELPRLRRDRL